LRTLIALITLLLACPAAADIYKCVDSAGRISYNDSGCPEGTRLVEVRKEINPATAPEKVAPPLSDKLSAVWKGKRIDVNRHHLMAVAAYFVMSLLCYFAYDADQQKAFLRQARIPERTLHLIELLGGWPGGFIAQRRLHHKSRNVPYQVVFWCIVALHAAVWIDLLALDGKMLETFLVWVEKIFNLAHDARLG